MSIAAADYDRLEGMIRALPDDEVDKVFSYVAFLDHLQHMEDEEDLRDVLDREGEECVPFEEVQRELGLL